MVRIIDVKNVDEFEEKAIKKTLLREPDTPKASISTQLGHIFAGGYSAGYYSYKWAEVLDADAFEKFKEDGIFNKETAKSFRDNILSQGNKEHPMKLYKKFRGRSQRSMLLKENPYFNFKLLNLYFFSLYLYLMILKFIVISCSLTSVFKLEDCKNLEIRHLIPCLDKIYNSGNNI